MVQPIIQYRLTDHAKEEMARRQISQEDVAKTLANPGQMEMLREGRAVYHARIECGEPAKIYLLRVFVDIHRMPPEVVTVYRTRKFDKYWRKDS